MKILIYSHTQNKVHKMKLLFLVDKLSIISSINPKYGFMILMCMLIKPDLKSIINAKHLHLILSQTGG